MQSEGRLGERHRGTPEATSERVATSRGFVEPEPLRRTLSAYSGRLKKKFSSLFQQDESGCGGCGFESIGLGRLIRLSIGLCSRIPTDSPKTNSIQVGIDALGRAQTLWIQYH